MNARLRNLGFLFKDITQLYVRYFEREAAQHGLNLGQCKALVTLSRNQGVTQARLAELSDTDPMTLVRILDRMERDDLLERRPDPVDRRAHRIHLKPASRAVLDEITRIGDKARGEILAGLSSDERNQLVDLLQRVHENLSSLVSK